MFTKLYHYIVLSLITRMSYVGELILVGICYSSISYDITVVKLFIFFYFIFILLTFYFHIQKIKDIYKILLLKWLLINNGKTGNAKKFRFRFRLSFEWILKCNKRWMNWSVTASNILLCKIWCSLKSDGKIMFDYNLTSVNNNNNSD